MKDHYINKQIAEEPYRYTIALGAVDSIFGIFEKSVNDLTSGVFSSKVHYPINYLNVISKDFLLDLLENICGGINSDKSISTSRAVTQHFFDENHCLVPTNSSELWC